MSVARKSTRTHHCRCGMTAQPNQASACFSDNIILCRTFSTSWLRKTCAKVKLAANCVAKIADDSNVQKRRMFCVFVSLRKQANAWKQCNYMEHSFFLRHSAGSQSVAASHDEIGLCVYCDEYQPLLLWCCLHGSMLPHWGCHYQHEKSIICRDKSAKY